MWRSSYIKTLRLHGGYQQHYTVLSPLIMMENLLVYACSLVGIYAAIISIQYLYRVSTSALWDLQGPPKSFKIMGNGSDFTKTELDHQEKMDWHSQYGPVYSFQGLLGHPILMTNDIKSINHIIMHTDIFQKPSQAIYALSRMVGPGVLVVEGHDHKLQRRILNPAFGPTQLRDMTSIFVEKALELGSILSSQIKKQNTGKQDQIHVDMLSWLNRTTLDIIGLAGFGYEFNSLTDSEPTELNRALSTLFASGAGLFPELQAMIPPLRLIPTLGARRINNAQTVMNRIGHELIAKAKTQAVSVEKDGETNKARDLLSLLIKANMAAEGRKLSDEDVIAQVPTFFVAGHETTSTAVTWTLFALSQAPDVQRKLREELRAAPSNPTMDELNALPYLENVSREVLRLYAPVTNTIRAAMEDTTIPVSKPYIDRHGNTRNEIKMSKGDLIRVPIWTLHRSREIWGPDADVFDPDRWDNLPEQTHQMPGVVNRLFTFLGGPRACIGYRFALVEMKALIFALVRDFEFELAVPRSDVRTTTAIVQHPVVKGSDKHQLPMIIRLAEP